MGKWRFHASTNDDAGVDPASVRYQTRTVTGPDKEEARQVLISYLNETTGDEWYADAEDDTGR
ncbi:MAG: hypothetical protein HOZ81_05160 [Streptomyces sp.]|nr:hypothetical protein [Streptomyces sp.]